MWSPWVFGANVRLVVPPIALEFNFKAALSVA
jgi:hypothetical protein